MKKFLAYALPLSLMTTLVFAAGKDREIGFEIGVLKALITTPTTPAASKAKIYFKDGEIKLLKSDGIERVVGPTANLTGAVTSSGSVTSLGSFSSSNLLTALTDETGTGANVFGTAPTLTSPVLTSFTETLTAKGTVSGAQSLDLSTATVFSLTMSGATTLSFTNPPTTGKPFSFTILAIQDGTGSRLITWPGSVKWAGGTAPTLTTTASKADIIAFITIDGGTTYYGFLGGANY